MCKRFFLRPVEEIPMPRVIHQETMCCGYRRCPEIKIFDDGSVELSDDDVEKGSIGTIKLTPEAATRLIELISSKEK
jgi:hypothetical protein